jgi:hypothetical protein
MRSADVGVEEGAVTGLLKPGAEAAATNVVVANGRLQANDEAAGNKRMRVRAKREMRIAAKATAQPMRMPTERTSTRATQTGRTSITPT